MKLCKHCGLSPSYKGAYCTLCRKIYDKEYFQAHVGEKSASASALKRALLDWYRKLKHLKQCLVCGGGPFHFCQLDYDHVPGRGAKVMDVSKMVRLGYSKEKVQAEIAKCDLICKCCHALRTFNRRYGKKEGSY